MAPLHSMPCSWNDVTCWEHSSLTSHPPPLNQLAVQCNGCISLLGQVRFMAEQVSNILNPVLNHRWSLLRMKRIHVEERWGMDVKLIMKKAQRDRGGEKQSRQRSGEQTHQGQTPRNHTDTGRQSHRPQHLRSEHPTIACECYSTSSK